MKPVNFNRDYIESVDQFGKIAFFKVLSSYTMFMEQKNQYSENEHTAQSNL